MTAPGSQRRTRTTASGRLRLGLLRLGRLLAIPALEVLQYRANVYLFFVMLMAQILLYRTLWRALFHPGQVIGGLDLRMVVGYSVLGVLLGQGSLTTGTDAGVQGRIRTGQIVYDFLRPVSPLWSYSLQSAGSALVVLFWVIVGAAVAWAFGLLMPPAGPGALLWFALSLVTGIQISLSLSFLADLVGFWTLETRAVQGLYLAMIQVLSGALVPLTFFPAWVLHLSNVLPFAQAVSVPLLLYIHPEPSGRAAATVAIQMAWLVALRALASLVWARGARRLVVQGG